MDKDQMTASLIEVEHLRTHFHTPEGIVRAVDDVSFSIPVGRTLGVLGESGCGKSVTALTIMRLIAMPPGKIEGGAIFFRGKELLSLPESKMRRIRGNSISMIFQEPMTSLNPVYTIGNQIAESTRIHKQVKRQEALQHAVEMLGLVGIPSPEKRVHEYPHQLSGGMRQRAMIAMAMACHPHLLIADEPTTALDVTIQAQILDLMQSLQEREGTSIMMITHDLGVIAELSDYVLVMYAGQVMEMAPVELLFNCPQHPYTLGIMRSIPRLGLKFKNGKRPLHEIPGMVPPLSQLPPGCSFAPRCSRSMGVCRQKRPPLFTLDKHHQCRCWLSEKGVETIDQERSSK